jgi:nucleoid DNA-binding protein
MAKKPSKKFNFTNHLHEKVLNLAQVTKSGQVQIKRVELKKALEEALTDAAKIAASGERVRFPVIGTMVRKEVKARKAGKGINPFTKEPMTIKARPPGKKPRWSFPKALKETFSNKKNW